MYYNVFVFLVKYLYSLQFCVNTVFQKKKKLSMESFQFYYLPFCLHMPPPSATWCFSLSFQLQHKDQISLWGVGGMLNFQGFFASFVPKRFDRLQHLSVNKHEFSDTCNCYLTFGFLKKMVLTLRNEYVTYSWVTSKTYKWNKYLLWFFPILVSRK